jgi:hypothetical protein
MGMQESDFWPLVLLGAVLYLLLGVAFYVLVESRRQTEPHLAPSEMVILILLWPACLLFVITEWCRRWQSPRS